MIECKVNIFLYPQVGPLFGVPVDLFSPLENKVSQNPVSITWMDPERGGDVDLLMQNTWRPQTFTGKIK